MKDFIPRNGGKKKKGGLEWRCVNQRPPIWVFRPADDRQDDFKWVGLVWQSWPDTAWTWMIPGKGRGLASSKEIAMDAAAQAWEKGT